MDITAYHRNTPDWRKTTATKKGQLVGIELEVFHGKGKQYAANSIDDFDPGDFALPLAEDDSSLCRERGVEIICPPLPLNEVKGEAGYIARLLQNLADAGTEENPTVGYGMHININLDGWTPEEKLATQYVLNKFETFGKRVGRRATGFGRYWKSFRFRRQAGGSVRIDTHNGDKHCAAWLRGTAAARSGSYESQVMEVRIPKSTLNIEHVRQAVDYSFAIRDWVSVAPRHTLACCFLDYVSGGVSNLEADFLRWCVKNRPEIAAIIAPGEVPPKEKGTRLQRAQHLLMSQEEVQCSFNNVGIYTNDRTNPDRKKQAVRISNLIGKSLNLEGELDQDGRIVASTLRAAG